MLKYIIGNRIFPKENEKYIENDYQGFMQYKIIGFLIVNGYVDFSRPHLFFANNRAKPLQIDNDKNNIHTDATEGNTLSQRRGRPCQYTDPGSGRVNQTYARYPTSSDAVIQGKINRAVPEKYYKKKEQSMKKKHIATFYIIKQFVCICLFGSKG